MYISIVGEREINIRIGGIKSQAVLGGASFRRSGVIDIQITFSILVRLWILICHFP